MAPDEREASEILARVQEIVEGRVEAEGQPTYSCPKCLDKHYITYEKHPPGYPEGLTCTFSHPCVACPEGRRLLEATYEDEDTPESRGKKSSSRGFRRF